MSSVIIVYGGLALALLRGALIHEIVAQKASRRRLEQELHLALARMLAATPPQTLVGHPHDPTLRGTGKMR